MNYNKPEIAILGEASRVIESNPMNKSGSSSDGTQVDPAYDLDE